MAEDGGDRPPQKQLSRRDFLKLSSLTGGAVTAIPLGFGREKQAPQTITKTSGPATEVNQVPETDLGPKKITVGSSLETDSVDKTRENVHFLFPEGLLGTESPLIPSGNRLIVSFVVKSDLAIRELMFAESELTGSGHTEVSIPADTPGTNAVAELRNEGVTTLPKDVEIQLGKLPDGRLKMLFGLPNSEINLANGSTVNFAERFASGKLGFGIRRLSNDAAGRVVGWLPPVEIDELQVTGPDQQRLAFADNFNLGQPVTIKIEGNSQTPTGTGPRSETIPGSAPEDSKWLKEWAPDETITASEWLDDMISQGYIYIDATAEQYGAKQLSQIRNAVLVPNSVNYRNQGFAFIGNCSSALDKLVSSSQGHIRVDPNAYELIPGGDTCQVFAGTK